MKHILRLVNYYTTTFLRPFFRDHPGKPMPEENFWTLWCKGRLTEADTPTMRLDATPSWLTSAHLHHPIFYRPDSLPAAEPTVSKHWRQLVNYYNNTVISYTNNIFTLTFRSLPEDLHQDNHVINWPAATILDRESDKSTRWIKEAVHIRREGRRSLNQDEGSYRLSHTYNRFLATSRHYRGKNRKKNWTSFFWWRSLAETETSR